jgi:hypothetical protein
MHLTFYYLNILAYEAILFMVHIWGVLLGRIVVIHPLKWWILRYNTDQIHIDSSLPANAGGHSTTRHQGAFMKQNSL